MINRILSTEKERNRGHLKASDTGNPSQLAGPSQEGPADVTLFVIALGFTRLLFVILGFFMCHMYWSMIDQFAVSHTERFLLVGRSCRKSRIWGLGGGSAFCCKL